MKIESIHMKTDIGDVRVDVELADVGLDVALRMFNDQVEKLKEHEASRQ